MTEVERAVLATAARWLDYPDEAVEEDIRRGPDPSWPRKYATPFERFAREAAKHPGNELREQYVSRFDFTAPTTLYLTHHTLGDDRERGEALASLVRTYQDGGYEICSSELPDYLPVVLEFLALADPKFISPVLRQVASSWSHLAIELKRRADPHAGLVDCALEAAHRLEAEAGSG